MPEYHGIFVNIAEGVDKITGDRIEVITGGIREEMKLHRNAIKALGVLTFKNNHTEPEIKAANDMAIKLELIDQQIGNVIADGKRFKAEHGLV